MGQQVNKVSKLYKKKDSVKAIIKNIIKVMFIRLETMWSNYKQIEDAVKRVGGSTSCMLQYIEWIRN